MFVDFTDLALCESDTGRRLVSSEVPSECVSESMTLDESVGLVRGVRSVVHMLQVTTSSGLEYVHVGQTFPWDAVYTHGVDQSVPISNIISSLLYMLPICRGVTYHICGTFSRCMDCHKYRRNTTMCAPGSTDLSRI